MQGYFREIATVAETCLIGGEEYRCWFEAESTDFVRFNRSAIRQPGHVRQLRLSLELIRGRRHATCQLTLGGVMQADSATIGHAIDKLRKQLELLPEDPHFLAPTEVHSSEHVQASRLPPTSGIVDRVLYAAQGTDLVGILAAGPVYRGFANSHGQRNWHESASFNLDWSLYQARDKAVKSAYAGFEWQDTEFRDIFLRARAQLEPLARPPITVPPGKYRAWLAPAALNELVGMLNWDGFSEKALRTKQSSLRRMRDEGLRLNQMVSLQENIAEGLAPGFQADGFIKPARVPLIGEGRLVGSTISPRTAKEYGIDGNGADGDERVQALDMAGGELATAAALQELGTGIWISNLWYLNFSDRANCRITGMTRFASFWVENGEIVAPLNVMRFDDSLFQLLGDKLLGLSRERELLVDNDTYGGRHTVSARLPGALVKDFNFVL